MIVKLLGRRYVDFTGKEGRIHGCKLFLAGQDDKVEGLITDSLWISAESSVFKAAMTVDVQGMPDIELQYEQTLGRKNPQLIGLAVL